MDYHRYPSNNGKSGVVVKGQFAINTLWNIVPIAGIRDAELIKVHPPALRAYFPLFVKSDISAVVRSLRLPGSAMRARVGLHGEY